MVTAAALGMRHISWIDITVDESGVRAHAHGVGHRLPRVIPVSLASATDLAAEGTPLVVRRTTEAAHRVEAS